MNQAPGKIALVIDDDEDYRNLMVEMLEANDWKVFAASNGEEGIQMALQHRPDVVLCDLLMPRCNGFQVCRALRQEESLRHTKIVVSSGRQYASDMQAASEAGANEYVTKPVDATQLLLLLSRLAPTATLAPEPLPMTAGAAQTRLRFWGVRGSIPSPGPSTVQYGGNTSCVEVRADGQIIILDAGSGLRLLGRSLMEEFGHQGLDMTLLLTHTHWDHIQGLPFFQPVYKPQNQLRILGCEGTQPGLANVLAGQMGTPFFPIGLREVPANVRIEPIKEMSFALGKIQVQARFANHPGICVGYRLNTPTGSIAFFPDHEPYPQGAAPALGLAGQESAGRAFAHSENRKLVEFLKNTDVLIMDTQYDRHEYQRHVGWGHGCLEDVVALALAAGVRQLYLFHHDPDHDDAKISEMLGQARHLVSESGQAMHVEAAREGDTVELPTLTPEQPGAELI